MIAGAFNPHGAIFPSCPQPQSSRTRTRTALERAESCPRSKERACAVAVGRSAGAGVSADGGAGGPALCAADCTLLAAAVGKLGAPFLPRPLPAVLQLQSPALVISPSLRRSSGPGRPYPMCFLLSARVSCLLYSSHMVAGWPGAPRGPGPLSARFLAHCLSGRPGLLSPALGPLPLLFGGKRWHQLGSSPF